MRYLLLASLALGLFIFAPEASFAQNLGTVVNDVGDSFSDSNVGLTADLPTRIGLLINILLSISGIIIFAFFVVGGFFWMTAGGNEAQVDKAKKMLQNSVVGLIIILTSYAIARFVFSSLVTAPEFESTTSLYITFLA